MKEFSTLKTVHYSELNINSQLILSNLDKVIPRDNSGRTEVVWSYTKTDNLGRISVDPGIIKKLYPPEKFSITILISSQHLVRWAIDDIRIFFEGFRIFQIDNASFVVQTNEIFNGSAELLINERIFVFFESTKFGSEGFLSLLSKEEAISYRRNEDLLIVSVPHGIVHPLEVSETGQTENFQYGGVTDAKLNFIELSATLRVVGHHQVGEFPKWYVGANPLTSIECVDFIDEEVVFLGPLSKHYGHFILEGIARLWFFLDPEQLSKKAVYISEPGDDRFNDVFGFFGLDPKRIIRIDRPTAFRAVIVPEQSMRLHDCYHQKYKETVDQIKLKIPPAAFKKVYFSKEMRFNNRGIGEKLIENVFSENGYHIFYPERLSMFDKISILRGCESFAASSGTNAHNALFLNDNASCICLNRSPHVHYIQTMIDRMKGLKSYYVEANISLLPVNWTTGPFLFGPTRYLIAFFDYFGFIYNSQSLYDEFPKYLIEFLKAWGIYYNDSERKEYVTQAERVIIWDDLILNVVDAFSNIKPDMINR